MPNPNSIGGVVRLKQKLKRWRLNARESSSSSSSRPPSSHLNSQKVPVGHVILYVGPSRRRYVVPATHLNHSAFQCLLSSAAEEFGFSDTGPLEIPNCDETSFEEIHRIVCSHPEATSARYPGCRVVSSIVGLLQGNRIGEDTSIPLLR